jgi:hypothetical protein
LPTPGESRNCEPPYEVHASTNTTSAGGQPSSAKSASTSSRTFGRKRGAIPPHIELAGVTLNQIDGRVAAAGLRVVAGRRVDPERALVRVAQSVVAERLALEAVFIETSDGLAAPGLHEEHSFVFRHISPIESRA